MDNKLQDWLIHQKLILPFFDRYKILLLLSSVWMIGSGLRFLMMKDVDMYMINWLDRIFDWGMMLVLGLILLVAVVYEYGRQERIQRWLTTLGVIVWAVIGIAGFLLVYSFFLQ